MAAVARKVKCNVFISVLVLVYDKSPEVPDQRPRATGSGYAAEASSRGSLNRASWANASEKEPEQE